MYDFRAVGWSTSVGDSSTGTCAASVTTGRGSGVKVNWGAQALIVKTSIKRDRAKVFFIFSPLQGMTITTNKSSGFSPIHLF
jgi:hypothetical protein